VALEIKSKLLQALDMKRYVLQACLPTMAGSEESEFNPYYMILLLWIKKILIGFGERWT